MAAIANVCCSPHLVETGCDVTVGRRTAGTQLCLIVCTVMTHVVGSGPKHVERTHSSESSKLLVNSSVVNGNGRL